jgi:RNA polymerase sigma factor (sigma-70 family)
MKDVSHIADEELVQRALQGDGEAFSSLVGRYQYAVYGICLSMMGDFDAAEDVAQEAFVKAYLHLGELGTPARFGNWLRVIATNECRLHLRRGRIDGSSVRLWAEEALPSPLLPADQQRDLQEQREEREQLEETALAVLGRLSEKNRQALTLHYLGGHSVEAVAGFLGTSIGAVKMRLFRARKQLQKEALKMVQNTLTERELSPDFEERIRLEKGTAFFSDIMGFSALFDLLSGREVAALLNEYLSEMTEIVERHEGAVIKYEGDAVVAFWEGEEHALRGCRAALEMQERLMEWQDEGRPELLTCCGLNSGQMLIGDLGSRQLVDESIMGDTVNLAARLERETRRYGISVIIGESTCAAIGDAVELRELDRVRVPRRREPVGVYELLAGKGALSEGQARTICLYRQGLALYRERNWKDARASFDLALSLDPNDGPCRLYRKRCDALLGETPEWLMDDWDGVYMGEEDAVLRRAKERDPEVVRRQMGSFSGTKLSQDDASPGFEARIHAALAPVVAQKVTQNPELLALEGSEVELTAFFSDISKFGEVIDRLSAEESVGMLYEFLSEMTEIILRYEGTVDKYEGDAIVAFWGAPVPMEDHAVRGCLAALDMQDRLSELGPKWLEEGKPALSARCGLSTGPAVVGNLGSRQRMDYTMMGHHVNLGAWLEGLNREYGTRILISGHTWAVVRHAVEGRELDLIALRGYGKPVGIYEVMARKGELDEGKARMVELFARGIESYKERDWSGALDGFDQALQLDPDDGPSYLYKERCQRFLTDPPEWLTAEWDGAFRW